MQIETCLSECLSQTSLIKDHILELYVRRNEHLTLLRALQMLQTPEKSLIFEEVKEILEFLGELKLTEFTIYSKLKELFDIQVEWRQKISNIVTTPQPKLETLTQEMRAYRNRERASIALVQTRLAEFRRIFSHKPTCDELIAILNEDISESKFDNSRYIERLHQKYLWVTEFNNCPQTLQQMQCQAKPVKHLYQTLLWLAC